MTSALQQRTVAWHAARKGKLTASNIGAVLGLCPWTSRLQAFNRAAGIDKFLGKEFNDALGRPCEPNPFLRFVCGVGNDATRYGTANEPNGILAYSAHTGNMVQNTGLHVHKDTDWLAGSPDGVIGEEGLLEVKCPYWPKKDGSRVHKEIPTYYYMQMNMCMECADREWCDYMCWSPQGYKIYRVTRDRELHEKMMPHYLKFFAALQRAAKVPPPMSEEDRHEIDTALRASMAANINYEFWSNVDVHDVPPSPDDDEEPTPKKQCV